MRLIFPGSKGDLDDVLDGRTRAARPGGALNPALGGEPDVAELVAALAAVYAYPEAGGPWVRANMIESADGAVSVDGRSGALSGPADHLVFSILRSLADVIVVGAATARVERYGQVRRREVWPRLRAGRSPVPPIAVLSNRINLDIDGRLLAGWPSGQADPDPARTIVLTTADAPPDRLAAARRVADVRISGEHAVTAAAVVETLADLGYRRILVEGGPAVLGQFAAAGLVDDLCLTISPVLEGGHAARITVTPGSAAGQPERPGGGASPLRLALASLLEEDGYLLARYLRAGEG